MCMLFAWFQTSVLTHVPRFWLCASTLVCLHHHCKVSHWDTSLGNAMPPSSSIKTEYFRISLLSSWKPENWFFFPNHLSSSYNHALQDWESKCVTRTALSPHVLPIGKKTNPARLVWGTVESVSSSWGLTFIIIDPQNPRAKTSFP